MTILSGVNVPSLEGKSPSVEEAVKLFFDLVGTSSIDDQSSIEKAIQKSIEPINDLPQLMKYMLVVITVTVKNASFIHESASELTDMVLEHFWKGELTQISNLYETSIQSKGEQFKQFMNKWEEKLEDVTPSDIVTAMDLDQTKFNNLIKTIQVCVNQAVNKYIHSIKNLWFDTELIQDEVKFNDKVNEIREMILKGKDFQHDLDSLLSEEELLVSPATAASDYSELNQLSTILFEKPNSEGNIPFLTKDDIFSENPTLVINEKSLDKLAGYLSNGNKNKKEYSNLIRIIFNKSMTKGFTVKDIVRLFFISKYEDYSERKDFEDRYDVKRLFVKSTLENIFDTLPRQLQEFNVIKIEREVIQFKQQEKISFNYNFLIYDDY